jgi:hypothetical protein
MLSDFGTIEVEREISSEIQAIDLVFFPTDDAPYDRSALGHDQGVQQGMQQGMQQERRSIALKMLEAGASIEFVTQVTGYSIEEIEALQQQN